MHPVVESVVVGHRVGDADELSSDERSQEEDAHDRDGDRAEEEARVNLEGM